MHMPNDLSAASLWPKPFGTDFKKSETRLVLSLSAIIDLGPVGLTHWKVVVIGRCGAYSFFQNALDFAFVFDALYFIASL